MTQLILKCAPIGDNLEDCSVLENGAVVGRIFFLDAVGPHDRPPVDVGGRPQWRSTPRGSAGTARFHAAIIDFGGFLGIGTRKIAVDWDALDFAPVGKPGAIVLELTRNQVRLAPEYKRGEPLVVVGAASAGAYRAVQGGRSAGEVALLRRY